jgi:hypothetical protein
MSERQRGKASGRKTPARKTSTRKPAARARAQRPVRPTEVPGYDERDPMGRMALFSEIEPQEPAQERLWIECSSCLKETPVSALGLVKSTLPFSLHFPMIKRYHSYMRCPACGRRTWVRVRFRPSL